MICTPLPKLIEQWTDTDSVIDSTEPQKALLQIPRLHAKYCGQISAHSVSLKMKNLDYIALKKKLNDYYSGRMDQAQLAAIKRDQFKFVLKYDIQQYIDSDDELLALARGRINNEEAIAFCQSVVKELNARTWQVRSFIEWEKFIAGQ
jgi:hypothetical protein